MAGSTSSVWGSAHLHVHFDKRLTWDGISEPESGVSLDIISKSGQTAQITGSRDVVCKTQAEYKANKLNRNEQTKLESIKFRVVKEREISQRKFQQSERILRLKSAQLADKIQKLESSSYIADKPMPLAYDKRPNSEPLSKWTKSMDSKAGKVDEDDQCRVCERIQNIIQTYELEGKRTGIMEENVHHATCMFSDTQVQTFVHMLENKYFNDLPELNGKLKDSGLLSCLGSKQIGPRISRGEINNNIARRNVELRIQKFCKELEQYKKANRGIPAEVQESVERVRLANAVVKTKQAPIQNDFRKEVADLLKL